MWEQSMQVEALRLLSAWWGSSRPTPASWGWGKAGGTAATAVADVLVLPSGYQPAHLDERLAEVS
jgi:hypothetical protein